MDTSVRGWTAGSQPAGQATRRDGATPDHSGTAMAPSPRPGRRRHGDAARNTGPNRTRYTFLENMAIAARSTPHPGASLIARGTRDALSGASGTPERRAETDVTRVHADLGLLA